MTTINNTQATQQTQAKNTAKTGITFSDAAKNNQKFSIFMQITKDQKVDTAYYDKNNDKIMSNEELEYALKELQAKKIKENPDGSQETEQINDHGYTEYTKTNPAGKMTHWGLKRPDGTKDREMTGKDFDGDGSPDQYYKSYDKQGRLRSIDEYDEEAWKNGTMADAISVTEYDKEGNEISKTRRER